MHSHDQAASLTGPTGAQRSPVGNRIQMNQIIMKKLLTIFAILGLACTHQAQASLADQINENQTGWLLGAWEADIDGNTLSLSYKWIVKDHVVASRLKTNDNESYSLIGLNPKTGEIEQTGYDSQGKKSTGKWGPKGDMPMLIVTSMSDTDEKRSMAVAFRKIDENNIEVQIFEVDASGNAGDFSSFSFEMKRKKEKK
ncbi:MAG: hypothetical protein QF920_04195 [Verrucomicrobiota bacterium]|nr:hypothetical protein [Verrucomicrobiota bacterium]